MIMFKFSRTCDGGFVLYILSRLTLFGSLLGAGFAGARGGMGFLQVGGTLAIVLGLMYVGLLIWQIFNARKLAKQYNEQAQKTAAEPQ